MDNQPVQAEEMGTPPPPTLRAAAVGSTPSVHTNRPTAVVLIGAILLIFAVVGLFPLLGCLVALGKSSTTSSPPFGVTLFATCVSLLAVMLHLIMGIGLLQMSRWARMGAIISLIALYHLGTIACWLLLTTASSATTNYTSSGLEQYIIAIVVALMHTAPAVVTGALIYFLTRAEVIAAFQPVGKAEIGGHMPSMNAPGT